MAVPQLISVGTKAEAAAANITTPQTITPTIPTTRNLRDVLLCLTTCRANTGTVTCSTAGWSQVMNLSTTNGRIALFACEVDGTEVNPALVWSNLTTGTSGDGILANVACFRGPHFPVVVDIQGASSDQAASATAAAGGAQVTQTGVNSLGLTISVRGDDAGTWAKLQPDMKNGYDWFTVGTDTTTQGADHAQHWQYTVTGNAGIIPAQTFTLTGGASAASSGVVIALEEMQNRIAVNQYGDASGFKQVATDRLRVFQKIGSSWDKYYWGCDLFQIAGAPGGGNLVNQMETSGVCRAFLTLDGEDGSVTRTGAGWTAPVINAAAYGGSYRYSATAGDYMEWTSPAGATHLGVRAPAATNGGMMKVSIDGDATAATNLPTASQLVTSGQLAALGGFASTDRVLDTYVRAYGPAATADFDRHIALVDDLTPGVHTVRLTAMAEKNVDASANRGYTSAFTYTRDDVVHTTTGAELLFWKRTLNQFQSAHEFAHEWKPTAGATVVFIGNVHGYEKQDTLTINLDGTFYTPSVGDTHFGKSMQIIRTGRLQHPDSAGADVANVYVEYNTGAGGFIVNNKTTFTAGGTLSRSYTGMFPTNGPYLVRGDLNGGTDYDLTGNTGTFFGELQQPIARVWDSNGLKMGAALQILDLKSVFNWQYSAPLNMSIEDRVPTNVNEGSLSKIYAAAVGTTGGPIITVQGTELTGSMRYWVSYNDAAGQPGRIMDDPPGA